MLSVNGAVAAMLIPPSSFTQQVTTPTPVLQSPSMDKGQWRLPAMQNWYHTQDMSSFDNYNDEPEDLGFDERAEHWQNSL